MAVVFDSFHSWRFVLVNLVHEFPRSAALVGDLLNFGIEKSSFGGLDNTLE